jgi:hypothetical protein
VKGGDTVNENIGYIVFARAADYSGIARNAIHKAMLGMVMAHSNDAGGRFPHRIAQGLVEGVGYYSGFLSPYSEAGMS